MASRRRAPSAAEEEEGSQKKPHRSPGGMRNGLLLPSLGASPVHTPQPAFVSSSWAAAGIRRLSPLTQTFVESRSAGVESPNWPRCQIAEMPGRPPFSQLPDEVAAEILLRLPLREVARARLVCRRWHALTTDHHFVRTSSSRQAGHSVGGFFFNDHGRPVEFAHARLAGDYFPLLGHSDAETAAGRLRHVDLSFIPGTQPANPGGSNLQIYSSCHGLLLVTQGEANVYVCNPLTKKFIPISLPPRSVSPFNLAFDPSKSQHYKIVALGHMHSVHVYTSQTRSWRIAIHSEHSARLFRGLCPVRGIFWNGSIVWIVAHSLVRFVIEEEHLAMMPMPPRKENWICAYIGESAGHLQMIGYTKKDKLTACFDILEIQDDQSEWSLLYRVDLNRVKELYPGIERPTWDTRQSLEKIIDYLALSPIYVIRGIGKTGQHGVLIFSIPEKIMSYNMNDQEISMIQEIKITWMLEQLEQPWFHFYAYSPSLFSL